MGSICTSHVHCRKELSLQPATRHILGCECHLPIGKARPQSGGMQQLLVLPRLERTLDYRMENFGKPPTSIGKMLDTSLQISVGDSVAYRWFKS